MELSQIRYFIEAARCQHITHSAEKLHIAQPALTKSIHNLEDELSVPLFSRKGRNVVLTKYGEYLLEKLAPIINTLDSIPDELAHLAETEKHTIRLSLLAASTFVPQAIIEYKKKYPDINFQVLQNPENELYDIEITTNLFYNNKNDADNIFVCTENIFLAVPDTDKYRDKTTINLSDVKDEEFISLFGSRHLRSVCDKFCRHAGFEPNIIFESDSPYAVKTMIAANLGVGFWPEFTWGKIESSGVRLLKITSPLCHRDIIVTCKNIKENSSCVEDFFEFLKLYFQKNRYKP